jgi:hypothetical protein
VKASDAKDKTALLIQGNEGIEITCWVVRMAEKLWWWSYDPGIISMARTYNNLHLEIYSLGNVMAAARSEMQGKMSRRAAANFHGCWETHAVQFAEELSAGSQELCNSVASLNKPKPVDPFDNQLLQRRHGQQPRDVE